MCSDIEVVIRSFCPCVLLTASVPKAMPWATSFWVFSPFLNHLQCSILITKLKFPTPSEAAVAWQQPLEIWR